MSIDLLEREAELSTDGPFVPPPLVAATELGGNRYHVSIGLLGPGAPEEGCPCHKAPCGYVDVIDEFCSEHGPVFAKQIWGRHHERECPKQ